MVSLEAVVKSLAACGDSEFMELRCRREAEMEILRVQTRELKPIKVRLPMATAAREKALKLIQALRGDTAALQAMFKTKCEQLAEAEVAARAKTAVVDQLLALQASEIRHQLVPAPVTPEAAG